MDSIERKTGYKMRLHLKQQPPDIHGMITEHKASHGHKSKEDTVTCLIREAMRRYDEMDKCDNMKYTNRICITIDQKMADRIKNLKRNVSLSEELRPRIEEILLREEV